jgi:Protein of unknown function (DUF1570)
MSLNRPIVCALTFPNWFVWLFLFAVASISIAQDQPTEVDQDLGSKTLRDEKSVKTVVAEFKHKHGQLKSVAEIVLQATDGGKMLLTPDGQMWTVQPEEFISCEPCEKAMVPLEKDEIFRDFKKQVPIGLDVYKTAHFVIIYDTSETYAKWVGQLYEQLYKGFHTYMEKTLRIKLDPPRFPLVAVVFKSKESYMAYAEREIGATAGSLIGYYNPQTNRMITYDMTGIARLEPYGKKITTTELTRLVGQQPGAERTVATIVHEAVHQLSYNTGLQKRFADNPVWVSEGLALFFESPDGRGIGWGSIGRLNHFNLDTFRKFRQNRPADSLMTLISDDSRLKNAQTAANAYSESWAFTYFALKKKKEAYLNYIKDLSQLAPGETLQPPERVKMFKRHFGEDVQDLDKDFLHFMKSVGH